MQRAMARAADRRTPLYRGAIASGMVMTALLIGAAPGWAAPHIQMHASLSAAGQARVSGRVRPAHPAWRVRVQTRESRLHGKRVRRVWVGRALTALNRTGKFRVRFAAGGNAIAVRAVAVDRHGHTVARSSTKHVHRPVSRSTGSQPPTPPPAPPEPPPAPPGPPPAPLHSRLVGGDTLRPGGYLVSPDGAYQLDMQAADGNLVLYRGSQALWSSGPAGAGARLEMQRDGNAVLYNGTSAHWSSGTAGFDGAQLVLQNDGNLVISEAGRVLWSWAGGYIGDTLLSGSTLAAGEHLRSSDGHYELDMQSGDGNLVLYHDGVAQWASGGQGAGAQAVMQPDGNFVIYQGSTPKFDTNGSGFPGASLVVQNDGNLVSYQDGHAIWTDGNGYIGDRLLAGELLIPGAFLKSPSHQYTLLMQNTDGNLVLLGPSGPVWGWGTNGHPANQAVMQGDGNFVVYDGSIPIKNTGTAGQSGAYLRTQDDGNVVIYRGSTALWDRYDGPLSGGATAAETRAVGWARAYADRRDPGYDGLCLSFVFNAYTAAGLSLRSWVTVPIGNDTYPVDVWGHFSHGSTGTGTPPYGALVFWKASNGDRTLSHVAISLGGGNLVSTGDGVASYIHYETMSQHAYAIYLGWWLADA